MERGLAVNRWRDAKPGALLKAAAQERDLHHGSGKRVHKVVNASDLEKQLSQAAPSPYEVVISGLHNALLTDNMMAASLQQAGLSDAARGCSLSPGQAGFGEARIGFDYLAPAERCAQHFQGRQWGNALVKAKLITHVQSSVEDTAAVGMKADAPSFVPGMWTQGAMTSSGRRGGSRRSCGQDASNAKSWLESAAANLQKERQLNVPLIAGDSSTASTRDAESDSGDELVHDAVAWLDA